MSLPAAVVGDLRRGPALRLVHEVGLGAVLLMEIAWLLPWFRSLTPALSRLTTLQAGGLFLGIALLSAAMARGVRALELRPGVRTVTLLGTLVLSIAIGLRLVLFPGAQQGTLTILAESVSSFAGVLELVPNELVVMLTVLYAWRRGVIASVRDPLDPAGTAHAFRMGILAFAIHALVYREEQAQFLIEALPLYFAAALAGIGLARADRLSAARGGGRSPFTGRWLTAVLCLTAATTGAGVLIGKGLQAQAMHVLTGAVAEGLRRATEAILVILGPVAIAIGAVFELIFRLLREWIGVDFQLPDLTRLRGPELPAPPEPGPAPAWLVTVGPALRIAGTLAVLLLIALAALRTARRGPARGREPFLDEAESLPDESAGGALRGLVAQVLGRGGRRLRRRFLAAQAVRRLYQRLLHLAEKRGAHRDPAETPFEFVQDLIGVFPNHDSEVRALTDAYVRVRYGELPENEAEIRQLRACLTALARATEGR